MTRLLLSLSLTLAACVGTGGLQCLERHSDGSDACDNPVQATDLRGQWCDPRPDYALCLAVLETSRYPGVIRYVWNASDCFEYGELSGGLEFNVLSEPESSCFAPLADPSFYSASVDFTETGIAVYVDGRAEPLLLNYTGVQ